MTSSRLLPTRPTTARRARLRRSLTGGVAALALISVAGCGSSSDDTDTDAGATDAAPTSTSSDSAGEPAEAPSSDAPADVAEGEVVDTDEFLAEFKDSISKETTAAFSIETGIGAAAVSGAGDIDLSTTPPTMALTLDLAQLGGDAAMRLVDGVIYLQLPQLGGKFLSVDLNDPDNPFGSTFTDQFDIETQFESFGDAIDEVTYDGTAEVDGETFEQFSLTVDSQAIKDQVADQLEGTLGEGATAEGDAGAALDSLPDKIDYEMSFDEDGFFRVLTFDLGELGSSTIAYSDWGKDVSIKAPNKGQVTDFPNGLGLPS